MVHAELREEIGRVAPVVLAGEQVLPVPEAFVSLLPGGGLQRGSTIGVSGGPTARVLAWALLGAVTATGGWIAAVDIDGVGLMAAHEVGVAVERVLVVDTTGSRDEWSAVVGALVGAVDVVMIGSPRRRVSPSEQRRLASRARERGTVLVEVPGHSDRLQLSADLTFRSDTVRWEGVGRGHGVLRSRVVDVVGGGRRGAGRERRSTLALPGEDGAVRRLDASTPTPRLTLIDGRRI